MVKKIKNITMLLVVLGVATGCATKMSDVTDDNAPTMKEIYDGSFNEVDYKSKKEIDDVSQAKPSKAIKRKLYEDATDLEGYTRTANNEHEVLFKRIENPILVGYVFAHLTKDNIPIPAYSIPFRMSRKDYYAMPGEDQPF